MKNIFLIFISLTSVFAHAQDTKRPVVTVGSKTFTESYVLAEIVSQIIESTGEATVNRKFGMGATGILTEAVRTRAIDLYPEYSGTISEVLLKAPTLRDLNQIRSHLQDLRLTITGSLGFTNTYALGVRKKVAEEYSLKNISDLSAVPALRFGFSYEFMNRPDGFSGLNSAYGQPLKNVREMAHSLAYEAIENGELDGTDVYSTDAKIQALDLRVLKDDRGFFPDYEAVLLSRSDFAEKFPKSWHALRERLENRISAEQMITLNAKADLEKQSFNQIAAEFLHLARADTPRLQLALRTNQHLALVLGSLFAAILVGIPLGIVSSRRRVLGSFILVVSGVLQTIPSLALLCFLIPLFGVGNPPALIALFLYSLLPIVSNTFLGLTTIEPAVLESAQALGLSSFERLRVIELPLASPSLISGIRTSAIISIGTATLAALIGAGGYGVPIVRGLALNDIPTILTGAIPAALLALCAYLVFSVIGRLLIPRGIQK